MRSARRGPAAAALKPYFLEVKNNIRWEAARGKRRHE
jgi:hypothetical protein